MFKVGLTNMHHKHQTKPIAPSKATTFLTGLVISAQIFSCAPIINIRGYVFSDAKLAKLEKGVTTYDTLVKEFGSPTSTSVLGQNAVYYIYSNIITESYSAPYEEDRKVLAVYFDKTKKVRDYALYGLQDGIIVPIVQRSTEAQGKEFSAIQQIFGNIGRFEGGD